MWNHEVHIQSFEWNENRNSAYLLSMVLPYLQSLRTLAKFVLSLCSIIWRKKTRICCSLHELFVKSERFCKVRQITSWPTWNWSFFFWLVRCAFLPDLQLTSRRPFRLLRTKAFPPLGTKLLSVLCKLCKKIVVLTSNKAAPRFVVAVADPGGSWGDGGRGVGAP